MKNVEWGAYRINQLFRTIAVKRKLKGEDISYKGVFPAYSSDSENNGIVGYYNIPEFICDNNNPVYVIFGDHTRTMNIARNSFSVLDNVKVLQPYVDKDNALLFIFSVWRKQIPNLGYKRHWNIAKDCVLELPIKNGKPDFDFMESFIAELESERIAELSAYLKASGFDNYELSAQELKALENLKTISWNEYRIGELFNKIKTKKLAYKAKELPNVPTGEFVLPCLTSSFQNQGLNYYVPKAGATILKNVITIPQNSDVYRAYYQSNDFTVLSDAYAMDWIYDDNKLTRNQYLFMVMCINKVTDLPIYSYKNKLGGWNVVKDKYILLPTTNGKIDLDFMDAFISTVIKLAIKDVVVYTDRKIKATKQVVSCK